MNQSIQLSGCAIIKDNAVLLLYKPKDAHYEFPGGKVQEGESIENAAIREVKEEIAVDVELLKKFSTNEFEHNGKLLQGNLFLGKILKGIPKINEPEAFDHLIWMPITAYRKYALAPNVKEFCENYLNGNH